MFEPLGMCNSVKSDIFMNIYVVDYVHDVNSMRSKSEGICRSRRMPLKHVPTRSVNILSNH